MMNDATIGQKIAEPQELEEERFLAEFHQSVEKAR
jgi:hypothetical protein